MPELVTRTRTVDTAVSLIETMKGEMAKALPRFLTAERMARVCLTSLRRNPKLLECDRGSLMGAIMTAAQLGLEPDGVTGMAYLIPYGKDATFVPGYRGLLALAWRTGQLQSVTCEVVRKKDIWEYEQGIELKLRHVPSEDEDAGDLVRAYCILRLKDGGVITAVMNKRQIQAVQKSSRSGGSGPWFTHTEEMWRKTVLKRGLKLAPLSVDVMEAVALDEQAEIGLPQVIDGTPSGNGQPARPTLPPAEPTQEAPPAEPIPTARPMAGKGPIVRAIQNRVDGQHLSIEAVKKEAERRYGHPWDEMSNPEMAAIKESLESGEMARALAPEPATEEDITTETLPPEGWEESRVTSKRQAIAMRLKALGIGDTDLRHRFLMESFGYQNGVNSVPDDQLDQLEAFLKSKEGAAEAMAYAVKSKGPEAPQV